VAFSALGHVASLNGIPEAGVVVEGVSVDGKHLEETVTESDGSFRLQGLKPKATYTVRLRSTPAGDLAIMETASPVSVAVTMGAEDAEGLYFVMFRSPASGSISGIIEADVKHLSTLTVALSSAATPEVTERSLPVSFARSFEFHGLKPGAYVIRLRSSLSAHTYHIPDVHCQVVLNGTHASAPALAFSAEPLDQAGGEGPYSQQTSLMPITLTVIAMTCVVKIDTIRAYLSKVNAPAITGEDWVPSKTAAAAVRSKPIHKRK